MDNHGNEVFRNRQFDYSHPKIPHNAGQNKLLLHDRVVIFIIQRTLTQFTQFQKS